MSRKMHFQLNREIKMHQKIDDDDDDEVFEPERNFSDVFSNFTYELSFLLYNVLIYCLRSQKRVKNAPFWNKQVISILNFYLDREIKMQLNLYFCLTREIKMPGNAILTKKTAKLKWLRNFHAAKFSCNKVVI